jgi:hypothetical protein
MRAGVALCATSITERQHNFPLGKLMRVLNKSKL